jgi:hypothetical protein
MNAGTDSGVVRILTTLRRVVSRAEIGIGGSAERECWYSLGERRMREVGGGPDEGWGACI